MRMRWFLRQTGLLLTAVVTFSLMRTLYVLRHVTLTIPNHQGLLQELDRNATGRRVPWGEHGATATEAHPETDTPVNWTLTATTADWNGTTYVFRIDGDQSRKPYLFTASPGRLGNHLFQYASIFGIAMETNRTAVVDPYWELDELFRNLPTSPRIAHPQRDFLPAPLWPKHEAAAGMFDPDLLHLPDFDVTTCCYFQSWWYFAKHEDKLRYQFTLNDDLKGQAQQTLAREASLYADKANSFNESKLLPNMQRPIVTSQDVTFIGVHIRRQDTTLVSMKRKGYTTAPKKYINSAMDFYRARHNNTLFLISTDDIEWCSINILPFNADAAIIATGHPLQDLAALSECNHTIITVGSFGWWAGWLANGHVVYYKDWPSPDTVMDQYYSREDYFPPHWTGL